MNAANILMIKGTIASIIYDRKKRFNNNDNMSLIIRPYTTTSYNIQDRKPQGYLRILIDRINIKLVTENAPKFLIYCSSSNVR
jgi:hypothetical protein